MCRMRLTRRALCILNTSMSMNTNQRVSAEDLGRAFQDLPVSVEQHCLSFPLDEALMVNSYLLLLSKPRLDRSLKSSQNCSETNCHGSAVLEATESVERMWVPKTGLCALRESGKTPNTITGAWACRADWPPLRPRCLPLRRSDGGCGEELGLPHAHGGRESVCHAVAGR